MRRSGQQPTAALTRLEFSRIESTTKHIHFRLLIYDWRLYSRGDGKFASVLVLMVDSYGATKQ